MTIDLREFIQDDNAVKLGGFAGAVFLTYTLNLNFYEQMIAPALDQAGCASVLIVADPDGYNGAMEMGGKKVRNAGLRYICAPLARSGRGVQHVKVLLMAGAKRGRLLVGSGNLTLHGYGRNLELFSSFEYEAEKTSPEEHYAFVSVWNLLQKLNRDAGLPRLAQEQLESVESKATWLKHPVSEPETFQVWDNYDTPIWNQLQAWRNARGWTNQKIKTLKIVSPYFDHDAGALKQIASDLAAARVEIYTGLHSTNLDGAHLARTWRSQTGKLELFEVEAKQHTRPRLLHAKAIIGIENQGAWCLTGSANMTHMALTKSWRTGGNLELVTFRWLPDSNSFNALLEQEPVRVISVNPEQVLRVTEEVSENETHAEFPFHITELALNGQRLEGRLSNLAHPSEPLTLEFLHRKLYYPLTLDATLRFAFNLSGSFESAEAARVVGNGISCPYRWMDQPEALARYTQRAYHSSVRSKLETVDGTETLFKELMNFLWERVDPAKITEETTNARIVRGHRQSSKEDNNESEILPPAPEEFITPERLVSFITQEINHQHQYDRSTASFRALLSLALLRLTTPTRAETAEEELTQEEIPSKEQDEEEQARRTALERLELYLYHYCRRYAQRMVEQEFVRQIGPPLLFANHATLMRVLLEFAFRVDEFRNEYFEECFWWIWVPFTLPRLVGIGGTGALLHLQHEFGAEAVTHAWQASGLPSLSILFHQRALGAPPNWQEGLSDTVRVKKFMVARTLIRRITQILGESAFEFQAEALDEIQSIQTLFFGAEATDAQFAMQRKRLVRDFRRISRYLPPTQERYAPLLKLQEFYIRGETHSSDLARYQVKAHERGLDLELAEWSARRVPILKLEGGQDSCPKCHIQWNSVKLDRVRRGELVLCPVSNDALVYWVPKMPQTIV